MQNSKILYHGSLDRVDKIDLNKCKPWKDFGRGFYLTDDLNQAIKFDKQKKTKTSNSNDLIPCVSVFKYVNDESLKTYTFAESDIEWLKIVMGFRKLGDNYKFKNYDIIIGKIADDSTRLVLDAAINNVYGDINDKKVQEFVINLLETDRLKTQYCFKTKKAIQSLCYVETKFYND